MINWFALLLTLGVTIAGSIAVVVLVGLGIRLLATPSRPGPIAEESDREDDEVNLNGRPLAATVFAWVCFAAFAAIVIAGIWLIVPAFH